MLKVLKLIAGIIALLLTIFAFALFTIEQYFPMYPHIDTRFSDQFSIPAFEKLRIGASIQDVQAVLGDPIWKEGCGGCWEYEFYTRDHIISVPEERFTKSGACTLPCTADNQRWQYTEDGACSWWDFAWESYAIDFVNGKVEKKYSGWHGD